MSIKFTISALLVTTIMMSGCDYNSEIIAKSNNLSKNITKSPNIDNSNRILLSMIDDEVTCKLKNCIRKPFDSNLYNKLFSSSKNGPAGVMAGTYYDIENSYGLDIYAAGYTEEGEVDFDYIIVNNGIKVNYIELPTNSSYSINSKLEITGYSNAVMSFKYKVDSTGSILKIK